MSVLQVQGSWSEVKAGSSTGWVESRMLSASKPSAPSASVMQTSGSVVLRSVMGDTGPAIRTLASGTKVTVVDSSGSWRAVTEGSSTGWVPASSLVEPAVVKAFARGPVHVRPAAAAGGAVVTLVTGAEVSVLQVQGSWSEVKAGSSTGWVESRMLSASKPSAPSASVMQTSGSVVLRSVMGDTGPAIRTLASGTKVTVVDSSGSWRAVTEGSSTGWVPASSLVEPAGTVTKVTTAALNLRAEPSTSGRLIMTLAKDTRVNVLGTQGGWTRVKAGSSTGWVSSDYLR
ncbi:hypothetical protein E2R54_13995 [Microbacterium oleivorans]|uniref:SH3b domain-containing protein n=1 Tax=Microbacterium oleivorans TaxID=273677 RepID=A0A4R5YLJ0_9MICO|nr:hypothetical protein E2R54_13995 [Microbacterium oleivorans]